MSESTPKVGPTAADAPSSAPEDAKVFGYNVAAQSRKAPAQKVNPKSPLAAG